MVQSQAARSPKTLPTDLDHWPRSGRQGRLRGIVHSLTASTSDVVDASRPAGGSPEVRGRSPSRLTHYSMPRLCVARNDGPNPAAPQHHLCPDAAGPSSVRGRMSHPSGVSARAALGPDGTHLVALIRRLRSGVGERGCGAGRAIPPSAPAAAGRARGAAPHHGRCVCRRGPGVAGHGRGAGLCEGGEGGRRGDAHRRGMG